MPFMVMYRRSDGTSCHEQADAIDEAALLVERLRNNDGVEDDIRIYRMEEIRFAFRPYYKVELGLPEKQTRGDDDTTSDEAASDDGADAPAAVVPAGEPVFADLLGVEGDGANGRRGLFGR